MSSFIKFRKLKPVMSIGSIVVAYDDLVQSANNTQNHRKQQMVVVPRTYMSDYDNARLRQLLEMHMIFDH
jgi:hypothetical protein